MSGLPRFPRLLAVLVWFYRRLLAAYPRSFRREYGLLLAQLFRDCCRQAPTERGAWAALHIAGTMIADLAASASEQHLRARSQAMLDVHRRWNALVAILAGGLWLLIALVDGAPPAVVVAGLALSTGGAAALLVRRDALLGQAGRVAAGLLVVGAAVALVGAASLSLSSWGTHPLHPLLRTSFPVGLRLHEGALVALAVVGWRRRLFPQWAASVMLVGALTPLFVISALWGATSLGLLASMTVIPVAMARLLVGALGVAWLALGAGLWWSAPPEAEPVRVVPA